MSVKVAWLMFGLTSAQKSLGESAFIEKYSVSGLRNCFWSNDCELSLRDLRLKMGHKGYIFVPEAKLRTKKDETDGSMLLRVPQGSVVKVSMEESSKTAQAVVVLLELNDDVVVKLERSDLGRGFSLVGSVSAEMLMDNQLVGSIRNGKISGSLLQDQLFESPEMEGVKERGPSVGPMKYEKKSLKKFEFEADLALKVFDYVELGKRPVSSLGSQERDGMPLKVVYKMTNHENEKKVEAQMIARTFGLKADLYSKEGSLNGKIKLLSWQEMLDEMANMAVHLVYSSGRKLAVEDVLACYRSLYFEVMPKLNAASKNGAERYGDLTVEIQTEGNKLLLNGVEFDFLLNK